MTKSEYKKAMAIVREIVMERDGEKCVHCGKCGVLHLSHVKSRGRYKSLELDPDNLKMLCMRCHLYWWHKEPLEAAEWFKSTRPEQWERLKKKILEVEQGTYIKPTLKSLYENNR